MANNKGYKWEYENIGGSSRVRISSGDDIAHLPELDPKMWTVLSCPVKGLEIDEKSLAYIDCDGDGKIRVNDMICTSRWITGAITDSSLILEGKDSFDLRNFNQEDEAGKKLYASSRQILANLGKDSEVISLADTADMAAVFANTRFNGDGVITEVSAEDEQDRNAIACAVKVYGGLPDRSGALGIDAGTIENFYRELADYKAWKDAAVAAPYGDRTDDVLAAYEALDAKVRDFFVRSRLAAFSPESTSVLDVQTSRIESISSENLSGRTADIAEYPIVRITGKSEIDLSEPVNPAWAASFRTVVADAMPADAKVMTEEDWNAIGSSFAEYKAWKTAKAGAAVEILGDDVTDSLVAQNRKESLLALVAQDAALAEEAANIENVDRFLHVLRDFYRLVRNFVTFHDFYDKDKTVKAVFQSGKLIIDQRECLFCLPVADMAKHNASAATSGMFLVYCDCTTRTKPGKFSIVAAVTVGEIGDLIVGKNAVYYDESGLEWDAVITKVIDNPISVAQAFWSPYRRMAKAVENLISKNAADKDAKIMADATAKINAAPAAVPAGAEAVKAPAQPFDIGKFAGIFAALGMAVGMIGTALTALAKGIFALKWWQLVLALAGIMLVISGPAMVMAWLKLRRRNIAPLLNANGWAVNAASKISIPFGETLTSAASYPKIKLKDPYAKAGLSGIQKFFISLSAAAVVFVVLWLFNLLAWAKLPSPLPRYSQPDPIEEVLCTEAETDAASDAEVIQ